MATDQPDPEPVAPASRNASGRTVLTNALSSYATLIASALIGFVCTPLLLHRLGTTRFGVYSELLALAIYLGLLELGLGTATITRVAASEHSGPEEVAVVARTAIFLFTVIGCVATGLAAAVTFVLPLLFHIPGGLHRSAQFAFLAIGLAQAFNSATSGFTALLLGTGRMYIVNLVGGAISMATSIATVVVAELGGSLFLLGAVQLVSAITVLIAFRTAAHHAFAGTDLGVRKGSRAVARTLFRLGWRNSVSSVMGTLAYGSDIVLIGLILNPRAAAVYAIALRGYGFLQSFVTSALGAFGPGHAHRAAIAQDDLTFEMFAASSLIALTLALLCALPVGFYAHDLLALWLGHVPGKSATIVRVFCAVLVLQSPGQAAAVLLVNSERATQVMFVTTLSASVNVGASVLLTAHVGVTGPALGSLVAVGLVDLGLTTAFACRLLDRSLWELTQRAVLPLVLPTLGFAALLTLGRALNVGGLAVLPVAGFATVVDLALVWLTPAAKRARAQFAT